MSPQEQASNVANVVISYCSSGTIAFTYVETCVNRSIVDLIKRLCETEVEEEPWECLFSGVKISEGLPNQFPQGCSYFEASQGYYIGLLPGYIDVQCVYCQGELRCRYGLQKIVCSESGSKLAVSRTDLEYVKELAVRLLKTEGDFVWCVTRSGEIEFKFFDRSRNKRLPFSTLGAKTRSSINTTHF
ncbi:MAG: hypothetical protein QW154_05355 [Sulfolobales archaeon]